MSLTNIEKLFNSVFERNSSVRPMLRTHHYTFKMCVQRGHRNFGAIYITTRGIEAYIGKIHNGNFVVPTNDLPAVRAVAEQPQQHALRYGRLTGHCSVCGRPLVDPVSVHDAIGPICAEKFGILLEAPDTLTKQDDLLDML